MTIRMLAIALMVGAAAGGGARAGDAAGWEQVYAEDGVTVWTRDVSGSGLHEVRARVHIAAPVERVWRVLSDTAQFTEFMPYVVEARIIGSTPDGHLEYQRIKPPLVGQRDYVVKVTTWQDPVGGAFHRHWSAAAGVGPAPREDIVRIEINEGEWTVSADGDDRTVATYYLFTDPGGAIPTWIANRANRSTVPRLMKAVRDRALQAAQGDAQ